MYLAQPSKCFVLLLYLQSISVKTSWSEIEDNRIIVATDYKTNKNNKTNVLIVPISKPENDNEQRAQNNNLVFNLLTKSKREKSQESNHTPADSIRKRDYYNYTTLFNNTSYNQYEGIVNVTKTLNNSINFSKIFATPSRDQDGFNKATTENPENKQNNTSTNTKSFGNILSTSNKSKAYDIINSIFDDILLNTDINYIDSVLKPFKSSNQDMCLLSILKQAFMWWSFPNGTLSNPANFDVPSRLRSFLKFFSKQQKGYEFSIAANYTFLDLSAKNYSKDLQLFAKTNKYKIKFRKQKIIAFSAAYNELKAVPYRTLALINDTLKYLTLRGNIFSRIQKLRDESVSSDKSYIPSGINLKNGVAWATFPPLPNLIELDLSNCDIAQVNKDVFKNLSSLRRLYLAHNKMFELAADSFFHVPFINYLDLSFISVVGYRVPYNKPKTATSYIRRIGIYPTTFKNLTNLEYLDLSHTRLFFANIRTFTLHARRLKFLSLCYTNIPIIGNFNSSLIGLDLSGNQYAADFITENTSRGCAPCPTCASWDWRATTSTLCRWTSSGTCRCCRL